MAREPNVPEPETPERRHSRFRKLNLVQVSRFDEEGARADLAIGRTLDISRGGVRLELDHPLPLRSIVGVTLALDNVIVEVRGKVAYLEEIDDERCAMGIEFTDVTGGSSEQLDQYFEKVEPASED